MISAKTDSFAILMHCFLKQREYSCCSIVPRAATEHDQSTEAINTMMYKKTPSDHFVITIYFPQVIRTRHKINTLIYGWSLSHGNRRINLMNRSSDSVALNINFPCDQMAWYHYLPSIWMVTFNRGNHLQTSIFCNMYVSRVINIMSLNSIINNWSGNL